MNIELQLKVQDLNVRYAQAIDDNQLEAWPDFFTEDGRYRVTTAENFDRGLQAQDRPLSRRDDPIEGNEGLRL